LVKFTQILGEDHRFLSIPMAKMQKSGLTKRGPV